MLKLNLLNIKVNLFFLFIASGFCVILRETIHFQSKIKKNFKYDYLCNSLVFSYS